MRAMTAAVSARNIEVAPADVTALPPPFAR